jgi:thiamine-phosphate pyrophosphorylase
MNQSINGLYIITDKKLIPRENFAKMVEQAIRGGARVVQLREKQVNIKEIYELGSKLLEITRKYNVPLIINDYVDIACEIGADGVHLGENDPEIKFARKKLGDNKIIGVSCYNSIERGQYAINHGADYIVFGTPYYTPTKPDREPTSIETLIEAKKKFSETTVFAIGGITENNAQEIIDTGVDGIAAITSIFENGSPEENAKKLSRFF